MNIAEYRFEQAMMALRYGAKDEALQMLAEVLRLNPRIALAWSMRARLEAEAGRPFNAMLHHGFATQLAPDNDELWVNRGIDANMARMLKESEESFQRAIKIKPSYNAHFSYGNLLSSQMRVEEAIEQFRAAEKIGGVMNDQIYANLGIALIAQGKWHEGFQLYRRRFNAPGFPPRPHFNYPVWHGEPLEGKTILLYVEQGFGDEILSYRFAPVIKATGARVILSARPPAFRLARSINYGEKRVDDIVMQYDPPQWQPDYMCALLDVPAWIDFSPERGIPGAEGYLKPGDRGFSLKWPEGFRVGICWASGKRERQPETHETQKLKSLALKQFLPLKRDGVVLVNLMKDDTNPKELRDLGIIDPMAGVVDYADTAWIIPQLDLVITVDTSVAHLAGALGVPVWNLVRFDAMWPWMQEKGPTTCWYDSMRIYRQPIPYDWDDPLKRLMADFDELDHKKAAAAA